MRCQKCGKVLPEEAKFCNACGAQIDEETKTDISDLLARAGEGDNRAMEELYHMTYAQGYSVARQIVKNEQDASDLLQDAYISAFQNLHQVTKPESFRSWFNCIVANKCRDWLKKKRPQLFTDMGNEDEDLEFEDTLENESMEFSPEEYVDYQETKRLMNDILQNLPEDQKLCILMYYYEELSVQDIAQALDCSTGTVKSRLNYGRNKIKAEVEELKKKGVHLYGIAPIPFLVWMLQESSNALSIPDMATQAALLGQGATGTAATQVVNHAAKETAKKAVKKVVKEGAKQAGVAAVKKSIATKVIATVVGVAIVGGAAVGVPKVVKYVEQDKKAQVHKEVESEKKDEETEGNRVKEISLSKKEKSMLENMVQVYGEQTLLQAVVYGDHDEEMPSEISIRTKELPKEVMAKIASGMADQVGLGELQEQGQSSQATESLIDKDTMYAFLKDTFEYPIEKKSKLKELYDLRSGAVLSFYFAPVGLEKKYVSGFQVDSEQYRFFWTISINNESTWLMDIEAHKSEKSILEKFVFDKVTYEKIDLTGWQQKYIEYMFKVDEETQNLYRNVGVDYSQIPKHTYRLVYIDDNDVPELLVYAQKEESERLKDERGDEIILYTNGKLVSTDIIGRTFSYIERSGMFETQLSENPALVIELKDGKIDAQDQKRRRKEYVGNIIKEYDILDSSETVQSAIYENVEKSMIEDKLKVITSNNK